MTTNILIGFGGTGAKVVEAMLHCSAAGLGPRSLRVGFVDQDQSNGNVSRAMQLLETLTQARKAWRDSGAVHRVAGDSDLFRTDIAALTDKEGRALWIPHEGKGNTLARIFGPDPDDKALFDLSFAREDEQHLPLDEGYRGRPNIGAAAITARVQEGVEFWKGLQQLVRDAAKGEPVRLLLVGSVFGGTGAAGFPTIARLIRNRLAKNEQIVRNLSIGGVLMLPYFSFEPPPDDAEGAAANVARAEQLLINSKKSLQFYHDVFRREHIFDELYLVGWDRPFSLGYHERGAGAQKNPALVPELIGALGGCRFLHPDHVVANDGVNRVYVCARQDSEKIDWVDLPSPDPRLRHAAFHKLGQLLRFGIVWKHWRSILTEPRSLSSRIPGNQPWRKRQGIDGVDLKKTPVTDETRHLSAYIDELLTWAGAMQAYTERSNRTFGLWRLDELLTEPVRFDRPQDPISIRPSLNEAGLKVAFSSAVGPLSKNDEPMPNANALLTRFNAESVGGDHRGLGRAVAALHAFSAVR